MVKTSPAATRKKSTHKPTRSHGPLVRRCERARREGALAAALPSAAKGDNPSSAGGGAVTYATLETLGTDAREPGAVDAEVGRGVSGATSGAAAPVLGLAWNAAPQCLHRSARLTHSAGSCSALPQLGHFAWSTA